MDAARKNVDIYMALQLACGAISTTTLSLEHSTFWKELHYIARLLKALNRINPTLSVTGEYSWAEQGTAETGLRCLNSAWDHITQIHSLPLVPRPNCPLRDGRGKILLDTRFLLPLWLLTDQQQTTNDQKTRRRLESLMSADKELSALISAYKDSEKIYASDLDAWVIEMNRDRTLEDPATMALRQRMLGTYQYPYQLTRFDSIPEPCPGSLQFALGATLTSRDTLLTFLRHHDYRHNICWIYGDPASGKSVFMKHIVSQIKENLSLLEDPEDRNRNGQQVRGDPIIFWHTFIPVGNIPSMWKDENIMIQRLLLELFKRFPSEVDDAFHDAYQNTFQGLNPDHFILSDFASFKSAVFKETLKLFLKEFHRTYQHKPRIFIFLDGPSGFPRRKPTAIDPDDRGPSFVDRVSGWRGVKVCIASRPGGTFHTWHDPYKWPPKLWERPKRQYRYATLRIGDNTMDDIKAFCSQKLESVLLPLRVPLAAQIAQASTGSWVEAQDRCTAVLEAYGECDASSSEGRQAGEEIANITSTPTSTASQALYTSLLRQITNLPKTFTTPGYSFVCEPRLSTLSKYLNIILTHNKYSFSTARNQRPLSLLEFTLAVNPSYRDTLPSRPLGKYLFPLSSACQRVATRVSKELYPLIVIREMEEHEKLQGVDKHERLLGVDATIAQGHETLWRAAELKVTLLHESLGEYLTSDRLGREILGMEDWERAEKSMREQREMRRLHTERMRREREEKGKKEKEGKEKEKQKENKENVTSIDIPVGSPCSTSSSIETQMSPEFEVTRPQFLHPRLEWVLKASLYEHCILMPEQTAKDFNESVHVELSERGVQERAQGQTHTPAALDPTVSHLTAEGAASAPPLYRPYREHLEFARRSLPMLQGWDVREVFVDLKKWASAFPQQVSETCRANRSLDDRDDGVEEVGGVDEVERDHTKRQRVV